MKNFREKKSQMMERIAINSNETYSGRIATEVFHVHMIESFRKSESTSSCWLYM